ncbi:MAG: GFA family protein [Halofilum sp. (in: g-proteobacteria)]
MAETIRTGRCLCGAVRYRHAGPLGAVVACHCEQCRRTSGHFVAGSPGHSADLTIESSGALRWYESSPEVYRGFCRECGSSLFWTDRPEQITIMAGTLDQPTGLELTYQIYTAYAGDYYRIDPQLPSAPEAGDEMPEVPESGSD